MKSLVREDTDIRIVYNLEGQRRKDLVRALSETLSWEPKYLGAPTFNYQVGGYIITRDGTILCPGYCTRGLAEQIILKLKERGFDPVSSNLMLFIVSLPREMFDEASLARLRNLIASKETVLKAALGAQALPIGETEGELYFPWFTLSGADGEADAYTKLITALGRTACEQKHISAYEKPQENLKYVMRLFLVRLGFIGEEYRQARKILLRNLSGNCSWKAGHAPKARETSDPSGTTEGRNAPNDTSAKTMGGDTNEKEPISEPCDRGCSA